MGEYRTSEHKIERVVVIGKSQLGGFRQRRVREIGRVVDGDKLKLKVWEMPV